MTFVRAWFALALLVGSQAANADGRMYASSFDGARQLPFARE